ncbi:MAG TPA: deoxyribonuclease IV [bacterium]|nr:deoxyribonuclease IV [bacterium]HOL47885.1 deoxyribonuclease IV [bacterium]HPQ19677.1 deoxyribonuclease IV [bacterium]
MKFGLHLSISGGIENSIIKAKELNCDTFQIFVSNPRAWAEKYLENEEIEKFQITLKNSGINEFVIHMPYLPNLASPDAISYKKSINIFIKNLHYTKLLNAKFLVIHPGNSLDSSEEQAINRVSNAINVGLSHSVSNSIVLIETTSGQGTEIGFTFKQIGEIIKRVKNKKRIGICIDTAHIFAAGYTFASQKELEKITNEIDYYIGFDKVFLIHLNDAKVKEGSYIDRHQHLGEGTIGLNNLKRFLKYDKFSNQLCILETPKESDEDDKKNLAIARKLFYE